MIVKRNKQADSHLRQWRVRWRESGARIQSKTFRRDSVLVSMQIEIERACSRLILLYAQAIDEGNVELAVGCYTEDAARRIGNRSAHGREQIQDTLDAAM